MSRQKELDADPKAIQQIEFVGQSKKIDKISNATDGGVEQSMFFLTILNQRNKTNVSQGRVMVP